MFQCHIWSYTILWLINDFVVNSSLIHFHVHTKTSFNCSLSMWSSEFTLQKFHNLSNFFLSIYKPRNLSRCLFLYNNPKIMFVLAVSRFKKFLILSASTVEIHFISQTLSTSRLAFKGHSSLFCTISTEEREAELQIILYLEGLLSCSFSIKFLRTITQSCLNLAFNSLVTCEFCNANFVAVLKLRWFHFIFFSINPY